MSDRTALLIRCSNTEATVIREQAALERRTVSNYVLNIVIKALQIDDKLSATRELDRTPYFAPTSVPGPRTAILVRCSNGEAARIRTAAKQRKTTIGSYVLHSLRRFWAGKQRPPLLPNHHLSGLKSPLT
ncbi:MAG TPA: hypothetical protein VFB23_05530 [Candidatus Acidoferrales bacterium]|nr:hypothetical protein [Candidatus Acidoferrales bacterium]